MKVVIATPLYPPEIGGPAKYARALHQGFLERGIAAPVVVYGRLERSLPFGIRNLAYFLRILPRVLVADSVLALDTWSVGFPALIAAKLARKRFIVRIGGDFLWELYVGRTKELVRLSDFYQQARLSFKERLIFRGTRYLLRSADVLVFTTRWQERIWQKAYGFDESRARFIENYFPEERDFGEAKRRSFVSAGRAHPLKNQKLLEEVFAKVKDEYPDIELDTRQLPGAEHLKRVKDAYAVIVASVSEVNSNTAIEAIAAGKPCIIPEDSGGYERLKKVAIGVDARDPEALESAIRTLLDPERYAGYMAHLKAFTYAHTWDEIVDEFDATLR